MEEKKLEKRGRCNEQAITNMLVSRQGAQGGLWPPRAGRTVGDADGALGVGVLALRRASVRPSDPEIQRALN